jgi:hypothetical protein
MFSQVDATNLDEPGSSDFLDCSSQHSLMAALSDALVSDTLLFGVQLPMTITRANRPAGTPSTTLSQSHDAGLLAPHEGHALAWSLISLLHSGQVVMAMLGFLV